MSESGVSRSGVGLPEEGIVLESGLSCLQLNGAMVPIAENAEVAGLNTVRRGVCIRYTVGSVELIAPEMEVLWP